MKGPSVVQSDNLSPWDWKKEKAPRSLNTAPELVESVNDFELMETTQSVHRDQSPIALSAQVHEMRELPALSAADQVSVPTEHIRTLTQEHDPVIQSQSTAQGPHRVDAVVLPDTPAPAVCSGRSPLSPLSAGDKLEGYVPQFFLKQDGYGHS